MIKQDIVPYDIDGLLKKTEDLIDLRIDNEIKLTEFIAQGSDSGKMVVQDAVLYLSKLCSLSELVKIRNLLVTGSTGEGDDNRSLSVNFNVEEFGRLSEIINKVNVLDEKVDLTKHIIEVKNDHGRG